MNTIQTNSGTDEKFSVIVIGAGMGGLGAAAQVAMQGESVLLLEKHAVPGGFATSFVRGRFEFEGALHELNDVGTATNPGPLYPFFQRLGVLDRMQFLEVPEIYRSIFCGEDGSLDLTLPFGVDAYTQKLIDAFPQEKNQIHRFMTRCAEIYRGMGDVGSGDKINPIKIAFKHPWLARVAGLTFQEFMEKFFTNRQLMAVLGQLWGYFGLPPGEGTALIFIGALFSYLTKGAAFAKGRSHTFATAVTDCIEKLGGKVKLNALVNRILMDNGKAIGVELLNGEIYRANAVISNVNPICTVMKMLPPKSVPDSFIRQLLRPDIGVSAFSVYLGLNASPKTLGLDTYETFINLSFDHDRLYREATFDKPNAIVAACYNALDPAISPPNTTELVLTTLQNGKDWSVIAPTDYFRVKDRVTDQMIKLVERGLCPNVRDYIEVAEGATPITYYRYSKALDGAIYGTHNRPENSPIFRLKTTTPVPNLFFCGAWTDVGGGFAPSFESGIKAANMLLKRNLQGGRI
jgi:prolycopene isomerase